MKTNVGRMKCPVCGRDTWVRENKNGVLYTYCANLHHSKLNGEDSKSAKQALEQGKSWSNGLIYIYPNERKTENDGTNGTNTRANTIGRTDGQPTATTSNRTNGTDTAGNGDNRIGVGCF